jgi:hypothetical protein
MLANQPDRELLWSIRFASYASTVQETSRAGCGRSDLQAHSEHGQLTHNIPHHTNPRGIKILCDNRKAPAIIRPLACPPMVEKERRWHGSSRHPFGSASVKPHLTLPGDQVSTMVADTAVWYRYEYNIPGSRCHISDRSSGLSSTDHCTTVVCTVRSTRERCWYLVHLYSPHRAKKLK